MSFLLRTDDHLVVLTVILKTNCFLNSKQYHTEVFAIQELQAETKTSDSYFCPRLNILSPNEYFAPDRLTYSNAYRKPEKVLCATL